MKSTKILAVTFVAALSFLIACSGQKSGKANNGSASSQTSKTAAAQNINLSPHALQGKQIANRNGCMNCHTINGETLVGPSFKNLYGSTTTLKNGSTVVVDSSYIIQSLKYPSKKITAGFSNVMPKYQFLTKNQMEYIVAYLRELSNVNMKDQQ